MHLVCPRCHAAYEVPEEALAGHPRVRCARCGTEWAPPLPEPSPAAVPFADMAESKAKENEAPTAESGPSLEPDFHEGLVPLGRPARPPTPPPSRAVWVAWGISLLVVLAGLAGFFEGEAAVVRTFPPALRLYRLLGRPDPIPLQPLAPAPAPPPAKPAG
jgi:predicted Zn finger-like uncharacterized protein